jgi:hypothetical protein
MGAFGGVKMTFGVVGAVMFGGGVRCRISKRTVLSLKNGK